MCLISLKIKADVFMIDLICQLNYYADLITHSKTKQMTDSMFRSCWYDLIFDNCAIRTKKSLLYKAHFYHTKVILLRCTFLSVFHLKNFLSLSEQPLVMHLCVCVCVYVRACVCVCTNVRRREPIFFLSEIEISSFSMSANGTLKKR